MVDEWIVSSEMVNGRYIVLGRQSDYGNFNPKANEPLEESKEEEPEVK